jgi:hypothetical protein
MVVPQALRRKRNTQYDTTCATCAIGSRTDSTGERIGLIAVRTVARREDTRDRWEDRRDRWEDYRDRRRRNGK